MQCWDGVIMLALLFVAVVTPFEVAVISRDGVLCKDSLSLNHSDVTFVPREVAVIRGRDLEMACYVRISTLHL